MKGGWDILRKILKLLLFAGLCWFPLNTPQVDANFSDLTADESMALQLDLLNDFSALQSFLDAVEMTEDGKLRSLHAEDIDQAVCLLATAFSLPLAFDLVTTYCTWDTQSNTLYVNPMESIPILSKEDLAQCLIQKQADQFVVYCSLTDCYIPKDAYIYIITLEKSQDHWIITDLKLNNNSIVN